LAPIYATLRYKKKNISVENVEGTDELAIVTTEERKIDGKRSGEEQGCRRRARRRVTKMGRQLRGVKRKKALGRKKSRVEKEKIEDEKREKRKGNDNFRNSEENKISPSLN
jgi:hypothetical protein